jgi:hypothetical protein
MKDMMSQVRNSKGLCSFSVAVFCLLAIAVSLSGCKKEKDPFTTPGSVENPNWVVNVDNDLSASMTAIVRVSFTQEVGTLAAFMGDACCGVAEYNTEMGLYWLYISPATSEGGEVELRFYSPGLKRVFLSQETFPFRNDTQLGTVSLPHTPTWKVAD